MNKIFLFLLSLSIIASSNSKAQISIRPELGINISNMKYVVGNSSLGSTNMNPEVKIGFRCGAYLKIPIIKGLYVEPGLLYSQKGYSHTLKFNNTLGQLENQKMWFNTHNH